MREFESNDLLDTGRGTFDPSDLDEDRSFLAEGDVMTNTLVLFESCSVKDVALFAPVTPKAFSESIYIYVCI
jgi:hypothetical protein